MREVNKKEEKFYIQWEERRKNKWLYAFVHGSVYWGLPAAIVPFILRSKFDIENMHLSELLISMIFFMIGGLWYGLNQFKRIDTIYLELNDDDEIARGIQILKAGDIWKYENLIISKEEDETLTVQNELFWFEDKKLSPEKINKCLNFVIGDFRRLQKYKDFAAYTRNRRVTIQLFDNSGSNVPLHEKII